MLACRSEGGYLATVDSGSTDAFLGHLVDENTVDDAWLGGYLKKTGWHWGERKYSNMYLKYMSAFTLYHACVYMNTYIPTYIRTYKIHA